MKDQHKVQASNCSYVELTKPCVLHVSLHSLPCQIAGVNIINFLQIFNRVCSRVACLSAPQAGLCAAVLIWDISMKFGALLRESANETPELQNLYSCYKLLKKRLKRLPDRHNVEFGADDPVERAAIAERQHGFVMTLNEDVQQFNELFIEKEEESVIRLRSLEDAAEGAQHSMEATGKVFKRYVDFHGEMLLLVHWSILAYTGLVKILKKHHKRTGLLVRAPHLDNLLSQPFCSVEVRPHS